jgi:hypothetical protein
MTLRAQHLGNKLNNHYILKKVEGVDVNHQRLRLSLPFTIYQMVACINKSVGIVNISFVTNVQIPRLL